ncbi:MAG: voltage-gated potassium channel [Betaproteobacteria bacterium]|nr:voltage-gated potassium channel [Betaproteobacteria bacterium]
MDISISRRLWRHKVVRRGLTYSLILVVVILVIGGIGFWMLDPKVNTLQDGLWLSFTTAATVGYGDMVPSTPWSRAFAVLVVLLGLSVLSLVTASLAAIFVEKDVVEDERRVEAELLREIRHLRNEVHLLRRSIDLPAGEGDRPSPAP